MTTFCPSLEELIGLNETWSSHCVWHVPTCDRKDVRKCMNTIGLPDRNQKQKLVKSLRALLSDSRFQTTTFSNCNEFHTNPNIISLLQKLSELVLCKGKHRGAYSTAICQPWVEALQHLENCKGQNKLGAGRRKFGIQDGEMLKCCGKFGGIQCPNWIKSTKREQANAMLRDLATAETATRLETRDLATLLMCSKHRGQVGPKSEEWFRALGLPCNIPRESTPTTFQTSSMRLPSTNLNSQYLSPQRQLEGVTSIRPANIKSYPNYEASALYSGKQSINLTSKGGPDTPPSSSNSTQPSQKPIRQKCFLSTPQVGHERAAHRGSAQLANGFSSPAAVAPTFEKFYIKTSQKTLKDVIAAVGKDLSKHGRSPGWIYGFKCESDSHIKIGFTCAADIDTRMAQWSKQCHHIPNVIFAIYLPYASRIERIVHLCLCEERRRENLVGGACNGGKGCSRRHMEWFEVATERALWLVRLVQHWAEAKPYTDQGCLNGTWIERLKNCAIRLVDDTWCDVIQRFFRLKEVHGEFKIEIKNRTDSTFSIAHIDSARTDRAVNLKSGMGTSGTRREAISYIIPLDA